MRVVTSLVGAITVIILVPACALLSSTTYAFADGERVTTQELIENAEAYDGRKVVIEGEVVGDIMIRGTHAWITVNDDTFSERSREEGGELTGISNYGIGVWLPAREVEEIRILGGYKSKGDRVRIQGVFHRADPENGGDMDIHGTYLEVLEPGYPINHPFAWWKLILILAFSVVVLLLGGMWWKRSRAS
ncbi:MAG: hypothetical protein C4536_05860 [Actinobacteria bacterium]|jgi:hypothetical protein|nr:MAG: hypothetical protein C4536_05860 [Actinomycetota bacterium]